MHFQALWRHKKQLMKVIKQLWPFYKLQKLKFVKWWKSRYECCGFTKKTMTNYVVLKLTDKKWQGKKVNEKFVNWQCVPSYFQTFLRPCARGHPKVFYPSLWFIWKILQLKGPLPSYEWRPSVSYMARVWLNLNWKSLSSILSESSYMFPIGWLSALTI